MTDYLSVIIIYIIKILYKATVYVVFPLFWDRIQQLKYDLSLKFAKKDKLNKIKKEEWTDKHQRDFLQRFAILQFSDILKRTFD